QPPLSTRYDFRERHPPPRDDWSAVSWRPRTSRPPRPFLNDQLSHPNPMDHGISAADRIPPNYSRFQEPRERYYEENVRDRQPRGRYAATEEDAEGMDPRYLEDLRSRQNRGRYASLEEDEEGRNRKFDDDTWYRTNRTRTNKNKNVKLVEKKKSEDVDLGIPLPLDPAGEGGRMYRPPEGEEEEEMLGEKGRIFEESEALKEEIEMPQVGNPEEDNPDFIEIPKDESKDAEIDPHDPNSDQGRGNVFKEPLVAVDEEVKSQAVDE
ncbi:unnamed protein product, partial [Cyprideis torosa]